MDLSDRVQLILLVFVLVVFAFNYIEIASGKTECRMVLENINGQRKMFSIDPGNKTQVQRARNYTLSVNRTYREDLFPPS